MSQNASEQCKGGDGYVPLTTAVSNHHYSLLSHSLQTACIVMVGCAVASVLNILLVRCAIKLFKQTPDAMHLFIAFFTSADLLLSGKALRLGLVDGDGAVPNRVPFRGTA